METIQRTIEILLFFTIAITALAFLVAQILILTVLSRLGYHRIYRVAREGTIAYAVLALAAVVIAACLAFG